MNTIEQDNLDRGIPDVNNTRSNSALRGLLFIVLAGGVMVTALAGMYMRDSGDDEVVRADEPRSRASTVTPRTFVQIEPEPAPEIEKMAEIMAAMPQPQPEPPPPRVIYREPPKPKVVKGLTGSQAVSNAAVPPVQLAQNSSAPVESTTGGFFGNNANTGSRDTGALASQLKPTSLKATSASQLRQREYLLTRGNTIDCALSTALNSTVAGLTACRVTRDVYSTNGKLVLIERGSKITGEYSRSIKQGENRIFVLWSRLETPHGIVVDLDSPATGALGGSGVPGHVNNKFWQRFGAAFLLSLVDDAAQAAVNSTDTETGRVVVGGATGAGGSIASEILRDTINIPPTLYANQGARVSVFVARDLDFSTVYEVEQ